MGVSSEIKESESDGFYFGPPSSIPSKTKELGPDQIDLRPPKNYQNNIKGSASWIFQLDQVMDISNSAKLFVDTSTLLCSLWSGVVQ